MVQTSMLTGIWQQTATSINQPTNPDEDDDDDDDKYYHPFTKQHHLCLAANLVQLTTREPPTCCGIDAVDFLLHFFFFACVCVCKQTLFNDMIVSKTRICT